MFYYYIMSCYCSKLNNEVSLLIEKQNKIEQEMRGLQDLYILKNEQKEELEKQINYKKNQLLMIDEWSKLNLEDKRSIIYKISQ